MSAKYKINEFNEVADIRNPLNEVVGVSFAPVEDEINYKNVGVFLKAFEDNELHESDEIKLFSYLIQNDIHYQLGGYYTERADILIEEGYLDLDGNILTILD